MSTIVVYKSKYGSTKKYADWIAEELGCEAIDAKSVKVSDIEKFDTIVYGGGLYAETINGVILITKNMDKLEGKKLIVYSTGITPLKYHDYYDKLVLEKNFKPEIRDKIKVYNFMGKMIVDELTIVHKTAIKTLKKLMKSKENLTDMEKLLIELCDANGDFTDREAIKDLVEYAKS